MCARIFHSISIWTVCAWIAPTTNCQQCIWAAAEMKLTALRTRYANISVNLSSFGYCEFNTKNGYLLIIKIINLSSVKFINKFFVISNCKNWCAFLVIPFSPLYITQLVDDSMKCCVFFFIYFSLFICVRCWFVFCLLFVWFEHGVLFTLRFHYNRALFTHVCTSLPFENFRFQSNASEHKSRFKFDKTQTKRTKKHSRTHKKPHRFMRASFFAVWKFSLNRKFYAQ